MREFSRVTSSLLIYSVLGAGVVYAAPNQTDQLSPVSSVSGLPYRISLTQAGFSLPVGLHSGMVGTYHGLWVFIAGRINGLHGFGSDPFPPDKQNTSIYVVDPGTGTVSSRALTDAGSGLNQQQIDSLSVTSPQGYQQGNTIYMTGGYGIDTNANTYGTKMFLTAIDLPGIVDWVLHPENSSYSVVKNIRQISDPEFQISGGQMFRVGSVTQLVFGQNFTGVYTDSSNGAYSKQIRRFTIHDEGGQLSVTMYDSKPAIPDPSYRRRDLNVMPVLMNSNNHIQYGLVAYAGVFTLDSGVWTVPVVIDSSGNPLMSDPEAASTFKQAMSHYVCASAGLYSRKYAAMYNIFFGGMSYGYYSGGTFQTDAEVPFINQVTTVKMDKNGNFTQYLMDNQYPTIVSTGSNPGNTLLFGAGAYFIPANIPHYPNSVLSLDSIRRATVIGYIVGGIQSTLPDTNVDSDSSGSPYVFKVTLTPA